jgi:hypothetical protein
MLTVSDSRRMRARVRAIGKVAAAMRRYLPTEELAFLMELSIEPVATPMELLDAVTSK